ncbi:amidohydrolase [Corynebacterium sp. 35RC1]|nr:amidohydrolase [Corynebacterium sp. 35RC1]
MIFAETLRELSDWQHELYKDLHRHPELSMQEQRTLGKIRQEIEAMGLEATMIGSVGVAAVLENREGRTMLARADFDALPVTEDTGLEYSSLTEGVMHACGHDMHTTALLGALRALNEHRDAWRGTYIALFQPGEETAQGAQALVDAGLEGVIPTPDAAFALHIGPGPADTVAIKKGPTMSAADSIRIKVFGSGSHASTPQLAVDPVVLAASIVLRLQTIVSRTVAPQDFSVVTVGALNAGTKSNVIPDHAELLVNLRHYDNAVREKVMEAVQSVVRHECEISQSPKPPTFEFYDQFPLTSNNAELVDAISPNFEKEFEQHFIEAPAGQASEDFSIIPDALGAPYVYAFVGSVDPEEFAQGGPFPGNHSPKYAPAIEPTCLTATRAQITAALAVLA